MRGSARSLALYTTMYPGVETYARDWYRSLREQTDQDFQLWIGLDALSVEAAEAAFGASPEALWVRASAGDTPAQVRQRAFAQIAEKCDGVIMVDSDDVMHASRVASARRSLQVSDLAGCALRLVDAEGKGIGPVLGLQPDENPDTVLPRHNVFGLSNTAWRADTLRRCLPIPPDAEIVDWYLATRAWLCGSRLSFDLDVRMDYRQYGANMVQVSPPFTAQRVAQDTERVLRHFQLVQSDSPEGALTDRLAAIRRVAKDIELFRLHVVLRPEVMEKYLDALNALQIRPRWWASVAHPSLNALWTR